MGRRVGALLATGVLLLGCSSDDSSAPPAPAPGVSTPSAPSSAAPAPEAAPDQRAPSPPVEDPAGARALTGRQPPGDGRSAAGTDRERTLLVDGGQRRYLEHLPPGPTAGAPLVIDLHGLGSTPERQREWTALDPLADERGFVVLRPAADPPLRLWDPRADAPFISGLIDTAVAEHGVDPDQVVLVGFSAGGIAATVLGAALDGEIAGIVPVAGALLGVEGLPSDPDAAVAARFVANLQDPVVPAERTEEAAEQWVEWNACDPEPEVTQEPDGVTTSRWIGCDDGVEVVLTTYDAEIGHVVPWEQCCGVGAPEVVDGLLGALGQ